MSFTQNPFRKLRPSKNSYFFPGGTVPCGEVLRGVLEPFLGGVSGVYEFIAVITVTHRAFNSNSLIIQSFVTLLHIELKGSVSSEPIFSNTGTPEGCFK